MAKKSSRKRSDHVYKGKKIVVTFTPERCTHVAKCLNELPRVFMEIREPWIMPDLADPDDVARVVMLCPSGALHYKRVDGKPGEPIPSENSVTVTWDGPLYLRGNIDVRNLGGKTILRDTRVGLCRCGKSKHKPFCDDSHAASQFKDMGKFITAPETAVDCQPSKGKLVVTGHPRGPLLLEGPMTLYNSQDVIAFRGERLYLCGCGRSETKPLCDGSHRKRKLFSRRS